MPIGSIFPVADLIARNASIQMGKIGYEGLRQKGELIEINNRVIFRPDLDNKLQPIDTYIIDTSVDREGCMLRYEPPMTIDGIVPDGAYIISVDPIGQNTSGGKSFTSIVVMKTPLYAGAFGTEKIVATYKGRNNENPQGFVHELLMKLSSYYNAKISFENDRDGGILQYFNRKGQLSRLMSKPEMTMSKYIPNSKTLLREYGHSMATERHRRIGEDLLLEWLLKRHPDKKLTDEETGETIERLGKRNLDMLEDRALIEELIAYNRDGNFDTVMALIGAIIQLNEHFNDDLLEERQLYSRSDVSDFLTELYVGLYGTKQEKYELAYSKEHKKNKNNKIGTDNDIYD